MPYYPTDEHNRNNVTPISPAPALDYAGIITAELLQDSTCEVSMNNGVRVVRVFQIQIHSSGAWDKAGEGGDESTLASGTSSPAAYKSIEAASMATLPRLYDKEVYYPYGSGTKGIMRGYNLVCTKIWTQTDSDKKFKVFTEWMDNSGVPLLVDSGFVAKSEGMLALVQYNHDKFDNTLTVQYTPSGVDSGTTSGDLYWNQCVLIDKYRPHLTRSYTGIASSDPYQKSLNVLGCVDQETRTQLCTAFLYGRRADGYYDVKLMFAEELDGWDKTKVWQDQLGRVPLDIAANLPSITGWENGPLAMDAPGGGKVESSGCRINGAFRPNMYDVFTVISGTESGYDHAENLPYQIADQFPLPQLGL